jgi:hypothetical protein
MKMGLTRYGTMSRDIFGMRLVLDIGMIIIIIMMSVAKDKRCFFQAGLIM